MTADAIERPAHYTFADGFEMLDVVEAWELDFHLGNVIKYLCRCRHKGDELGDLKKARFYLDRRITLIEGRGVSGLGLGTGADFPSPNLSRGERDNSAPSSYSPLSILPEAECHCSEPCGTESKSPSPQPSPEGEGALAPVIPDGWARIRCGIAGMTDWYFDFEEQRYLRVTCSDFIEPHVFVIRRDRKDAPLDPNDPIGPSYTCEPIIYTHGDGCQCRSCTAKRARHRTRRYLEPDGWGSAHPGGLDAAGAADNSAPASSASLTLVIEPSAEKEPVKGKSRRSYGTVDWPDTLPEFVKARIEAMGTNHIARDTAKIWAILHGGSHMDILPEVKRLTTSMGGTLYRGHRPKDREEEIGNREEIESPSPTPPTRGGRNSAPAPAPPPPPAPAKPILGRPRKPEPPPPAVDPASISREIPKGAIYPNISSGRGAIWSLMDGVRHILENWTQQERQLAAAVGMNMDIPPGQALTVVNWTRENALACPGGANR